MMIIERSGKCEATPSSGSGSASMKSTNASSNNSRHGIATVMRILGIDPGLNTTGYGVLDFVGRQPPLVEAGVVRGKSDGTLAERVKEIHAGVADVIASLKPEVLAIEELYSHYDRPTTAILMGHARGVIVLAAAQAGIPVASYPSTQIKKTITGNGHAAKWQMQEAIRRELNLPAAARAARRGRCAGDRAVPLLSEPSCCRSSSARVGAGDWGLSAV